MGNKNARLKETEKILEAEGIRFTTVNNKSLRLYFQSQFTRDMEDEDFTYLNHIFELKVYLYFHKYYDKNHLIDTDSFLEEIFEKNIETIYRDIKEIDIRVLEFEEESNNQEFLSQYFSFKQLKSVSQDFNNCVINYYLKGFKDIYQTIELDHDFIKNVALTKQLEIYLLLNDNTNIIYFVLKRIFENYGNNLRKIVIYQVGLKTVDELMYTVLASYLKKNEQVDSVCVIEKTSKALKHIELEYEFDYDNEEKLENPIINRQHFFNFYQVLSKRTNLLELRILFFLKDYNFILLSQVLLNNKNLRILQVRNVSNKETETKGKELDFSYYELYNLGENIRDEIFIFFNYLSQLEYLEQLYLTHFWFNSEINFLACETAKNMKYLKVLSLDKNQSIINNDYTALENYNLEKTNIEKLNMGLSYYNMIRRFDYIIHTDKLLDVSIGVLDFISLSAFLKFIENTSLERVSCTLNKPCLIDSIPILFEQISDHPFKAKNLRYLYVLNAYSSHTYKDKTMNFYLMKLIEKMKKNHTIRKLSFKRPCFFYTSIKENEQEKQKGIKVFRYINKRDYNLCVILILKLKTLFRYEEFENYYNCRNKIQKDIFLSKIIKNIIHFRFSNYRKIVLE